MKNSPVTGAVASLDEAVTGSDCLLLLTNHRQFDDIIPAEVGKKMRRRKLIAISPCDDGNFRATKASGRLI